MPPSSGAGSVWTWQGFACQIQTHCFDIPLGRGQAWHCSESLLIGRSFDGDILGVTFTVKRDSTTSSVGDLVPGTIQAHLKPGKKEEAEMKRLSRRKAVLSSNATNGSAELEILPSPTPLGA
ncbi:hypothetical protein PLEOSDRAFT_152142 [Pleurotus ostreatus PC15]|uniref:Uncharacterized protein n=1 Tax=Pleurotus ostreatus (strain PC15) TaxID=1137138 RepID=A0A067P1N7_PLEO1|nr:hypothetical protein PLEOSDRAFT_152142 [Pleurotus ostreatus PC15]